MLKVDKIVTQYGDVRALQNVSFKVDDGEIVSIIGSNGSGKEHDAQHDIRCNSLFFRKHHFR